MVAFSELLRGFRPEWSASIVTGGLLATTYQSRDRRQSVSTVTNDAIARLYIAPFTKLTEMHASNSVIGKLQLTLGQSKGYRSNDRL